MGYENITAGTVVPNAGIFYKITKDNLDDPTVEIAPVNVSNGLAWNAANDKFYYVDSPTRVVSFPITLYNTRWKVGILDCFLRLQQH